MRVIALIISMLLACAACSSGSGHSGGVEGDVSIAYLRSMADARSQRIKSDIWIEGIVVLNDKLGESYKSFVVYDGTAGVEVKVDLEDVDRALPLYSGVRIRCEGLHVGREGERCVLGAEPTAEYVVDRIAENEVLNRMTINISGDSRERARTVAIADIGVGDLMDYVRIDGVWLVDEERGTAWCDAVSGSDFESSLRHFTDGVDILKVATLNGCDYATEPIDDGVVTLIGVVDSYRGELVVRLSDKKIFVPATL